MKIVLATHNADKVKEISAMLGGLDVEVVTLGDYDGAPQTVEDGDTLEENALKKAREARDYTGVSALADDTGLEVDALGGAPGMYAARYSGPDATYQSNCEKLLRELDGVPESRRTARFRTVMALALTDADAAALSDQNGVVTEGILSGAIAAEARGTSGFGYDPVFIVPETGHTLAELSAEEKNQTSHRYRALVEMREMLRRLGLASVSEER